MADDKKAPAQPLSQQLKTERSGEAPADPALHDTRGQNRSEQRLRNETSAAKKDGETMVKLKTTSGKELDVTEARWQAEGQTLRQEGFERAELVDAQQAADAKAQ